MFEIFDNIIERRPLKCRVADDELQEAEVLISKPLV